METGETKFWNQIVAISRFSNISFEDTVCACLLASPPVSTIPALRTDLAFALSRYSGCASRFTAKG
jgi:hypothetical protein